MHEPDLWNHLLGHDIQPLRLAFRWIMRGFSGHLPPDQLLFLWDLVLAYDSMEVCLSCGNFTDRFNTNEISLQIFPLLAATILSFRKENLMLVDNLQVDKLLCYGKYV